MKHITWSETCSSCKPSTLQITHLRVTLFPSLLLFISFHFPLLFSLNSEHRSPPYSSNMGDRSPPRQVQVHPQQRSYLQDPTWKISGGGRHVDHHQHQGSGGGPSASKIIAVVTLVPVGGTLLGLSGLTLAATLFGLAVSTPVFLLFSPVIVPAALAICLAIAAFLTSGVFGLTALSSLSWVYRYIRRATGTVPEQMDMAKRKMQDMAGYVGQKTKEVGQEIQSRTQDQGRRSGTTEQRT